MKRIEKWLEKQSNYKQYAHSTISKYYSVKHLIIRYSDHVHWESEADIQIIIPTSSKCDYYTVIYSNQSRIMILNAKQIIDMIPTLADVKELSVVESKPSKEEAKEKSRVKESITEVNGWKWPNELITFSEYDSVKYQDFVNNKKARVWSIDSVKRLQSLLSSKYSKIKGYNGEFVKFMLTTETTINELHNIFYIICILNNSTPNISLCNTVLNYIRNNL